MLAFVYLQKMESIRIVSGSIIRGVSTNRIYSLRLLIKILFLLLLLPFALHAQDNATLFDTYMKGQAQLYGFNGNVLVAKNGKVIYKRSFGFADYNTKKKLDSNSIFDCGSIAKEFTLVGILLLADKGKISYSDTLRHFFPQLPYSNITIQQLLTHTSGIPNGFSVVAKKFDHDKIATNADLLRLAYAPIKLCPANECRYILQT